RFTARQSIVNLATANYSVADAPQFVLRNGQAVFIGPIRRTEPYVQGALDHLYLSKIVDMSYVVDIGVVNAGVVKKDILPTKSQGGFYLSDKNSLIQGLFALRHWGATPGEATYLDNQDGTAVYFIPAVRWAPTKFGGQRPYVGSVMRVDQKGNVTD